MLPSSLSKKLWNRDKYIMCYLQTNFLVSQGPVLNCDCSSCLRHTAPSSQCCQPSHAMFSPFLVSAFLLSGSFRAVSMPCLIHAHQCLLLRQQKPLFWRNGWRLDLERTLVTWMACNPFALNHTVAAPALRYLESFGQAKTAPSNTLDMIKYEYIWIH